jgi:hypothetical protein
MNSNGHRFWPKATTLGLRLIMAAWPTQPGRRDSWRLAGACWPMWSLPWRWWSTREPARQGVRVGDSPTQHGIDGVAKMVRCDGGALMDDVGDGVLLQLGEVSHSRIWEKGTKRRAPHRRGGGGVGGGGGSGSHVGSGSLANDAAVEPGRSRRHEARWGDMPWRQRGRGSAARDETARDTLKVGDCPVGWPRRTVPPLIYSKNSNWFDRKIAFVCLKIYK